MSEFSESYHLFSTLQDDGVMLLKKAWLRGFVFPESNHWVTLLPGGSVFQPNKRLISANKGTLVHFIHAEDHGWSFSIYDGSKRTCHYECSWEEEVEIDQEEFNRDRVVELINNNPASMHQVTPLEITRIFYMNDLDEIFEKDPIGQLAKLLGLEHYEWLSYDYIQQDFKDNPAEMLNKGIKSVNSLLSF